MSGHRWSGWPGAWCLDCGLEDATEIALAGSVEETHHRYSDLPHTEQPCVGCATGECSEPGSKKHDPYARADEKEQPKGVRNWSGLFRWICLRHLERRVPRYEWFSWECRSCRRAEGRWD